MKGQTFKNEQFYKRNDRLTTIAAFKQICPKYLPNGKNALYV
jgi:hypothetical protein